MVIIVPTFLGLHDECLSLIDVEYRNRVVRNNRGD